MRRYLPAETERVLVGHGDAGGCHHPRRPPCPHHRHRVFAGAAHLPCQPAAGVGARLDPADPGTFEDVERHPDATPIPGVLVVRPDAPLFYANAQGVRDAVEADVSAGERRRSNAVIFDLDANDEIDITSAEQLEKLAEGASRQGVAFAFAHLHQPAEDMARATGLLEKVGQDHVFPTVASAVQWAKSLNEAARRPHLGRPPGLHYDCRRRDDECSAKPLVVYCRRP